MPPKTAKPKAAGKPARGKAAGKAGGKAGGKPAAKGKGKAKNVVTTDPRCVRPKKIFSIGGDLPPRAKTDVTRFVRWPQYVQRQRRIRILQNRLRIPGPVNQFSKTAQPPLRKSIFQFAAKYKPESKAERKERHKALASEKATAVKAIGEKSDALARRKAAAKVVASSMAARKPTIRCGLKCVTRLIEQKRAKLVLIAHDTNPLELVLCLPALCRKQGIPYVIVRGKALLGQLCGFKQAAVVAFDKVLPEDQGRFTQLLDSVAKDYLETIEEGRLRPGGLVLGRASQDTLKARQARVAARDAATKRVAAGAGA